LVSGLCKVAATVCGGQIRAYDIYTQIVKDMLEATRDDNKENTEP